MMLDEFTTDTSPAPSVVPFLACERCLACDFTSYIRLDLCLSRQNAILNGTTKNLRMDTRLVGLYQCARDLLIGPGNRPAAATPFGWWTRF